MRTVALTRSASADSRNQVCWAASARSDSVGDGGLVRGQFLGGHLQRLDGLVVLAAQRGLGAADAVELGLPVHQIVGGQPQPGIAQVGLDGLGAARHLGLAAQRFELAAQLGGQVGQPGQVGRHRVELADGLFLALAVLEHAGGLFDERAAVLRAATPGSRTSCPARR